MDGQTYTLDFEPTSNRFEEFGPNLSLAMFLFAEGQYASRYDLTTDELALRTIETFALYQGVLGFSTDPGALPLSADYLGESAIIIENSTTADSGAGTARPDDGFCKWDTDRIIGCSGCIGRWR